MKRPCAPLARSYTDRGSTFKLLPDIALPVDEGGVRSVALSPDGKALAAGYGGVSSGGVVLWNVPARNRLTDAPLAENEGSVDSVAFSADGKTLAAGWDVYDGAGSVVRFDND